MLNDEEKIFKYTLIYSYDNPCGGVNLYVIHAPKQTRLHHLVHLQYKDYRKNKEFYNFKPITSWDDIWNSCRGWVSEKITKKYKGKIKRGIKDVGPNHCYAYVEYKGVLYNVHGVWG